MSKKNKIAIIGRAPRSRFLAPFDDDSWEIWTCSPMGKQGDTYTDLPRWDRFFELHKRGFLESQVPGAYAWLEKKQKENPDSVVLQPDLDVEALCEEFGFDYFTNTVAYMIAAAIVELQKRKVKDAEIGVWGCDFAHNTEYANQRPNAEFWLGVAVGRGIKLNIPAECDLVKHASRYGYSEASAFEKNLEARIEELVQRRDQIKKNDEVARAQIAAMSGGVAELQKVLETTAGKIDGEVRSLLEERVKQVQGAIQQTSHQCEAIRSEHDMITGCIQEARYQRRLRGTAVHGKVSDEDSHD